MYPKHDHMEHFHSTCDHQQPCKFIGAKEIVHEETVQFPWDWFGTPTWLRFCWDTDLAAVM